MHLQGTPTLSFKQRYSYGCAIYVSAADAHIVRLNNNVAYTEDYNHYDNDIPKIVYYIDTYTVYGSINFAQKTCEVFSLRTQVCCYNFLLRNNIYT